MVPCLDSFGVVQALQKGEVDFGVMALKNIIAGDVIETNLALLNISYDIIDSLNLPIHHCLCTMPDIPIGAITKVASHIQALNQTSIFLEKQFPQIEKLEYQDTALAAHDLSIAKLESTVAVITTLEAAKINGLEVRFTNIANLEKNFTNFIMIKMRND